MPALEWVCIIPYMEIELIVTCGVINCSFAEWTQHFSIVDNLHHFQQLVSVQRQEVSQGGACLAHMNCLVQ